jgi:hypothetical protein
LFELIFPCIVIVGVFNSFVASSVDRVRDLVSLAPGLPRLLPRTTAQAAFRDVWVRTHGTFAVLESVLHVSPIVNENWFFQAIFIYNYITMISCDRSPLAWALTVVFGLSLGPNSNFAAVMNEDLQYLGESEVRSHEKTP